MQLSKRILLVDDDPVTNMINTKLITRNSDFNVQSYTNAREALAYLNSLIHTSPESIPDIIFLDINMPLMDGWEFLEEFQKLNESSLSKCRIIMLTSSIDRQDLEKSKSYTLVKDFMSKPLTSEEIKRLIPGERNTVGGE